MTAKSGVLLWSVLFSAKQRAPAFHFNFEGDSRAVEVVEAVEAVQSWPTANQLGAEGSVEAVQCRPLADKADQLEAAFVEAV